VVSFLSDEWVQALDHAVSRITGPITPGLTVDFDIEGFRYHLRCSEGVLHVVPGRAERADVSFTFDRQTATAIASGQLAAQAAFMSGQVRIGGDTQALIRGVPTLTLYAEALHDITSITEF
jgi:alkyl sulfatase BDS1-like metallo-beta-lactamase superfamily hydrolase